MIASTHVLTIIVVLLHTCRSVSAFLLPQNPMEHCTFGDGPCEGSLCELPDYKFSPFRVHLEEKGLLDLGRMAASAVAPPPRPVSVWLPPGYDDSTKSRYPVLYCHDGQNAIRDEDSWTGHSWRLSGGLCSLVRRGLLPSELCPIVVLIPSLSDDVIPGIRQRHMEYDNNLWGHAYVDEVVNTVKPLVDSKFRTMTGSEHTMSIGSSMGGQIAMLSLLRHPNIFGGAAALSPYFSAGLMADIASSGKTLRGKRLYLDNGGDFDDVRVPLLDPFDHLPNTQDIMKHLNPGYFWLDTFLQPSIDATRALLSMHGVDHVFERVPGARHNERAWAKRIDRPLLHLFGSSSSLQ